MKDQILTIPEARELMRAGWPQAGHLPLPARNFLTDKTQPCPVVWLRAEEVFRAAIENRGATGDPERTIFGRSGFTGEPGYRRAVIDAMERPEMPAFVADLDDGYRRVRRWKRESGTSGAAFRVGSYLAGNPACFERRRRVESRRPALNILFENAVPSKRRHDTYMESRFEAIYRQAVDAEQAGDPCRVLVVWPWCDDTGAMLLMILVLKDFNDPVFPGLWGPLRRNLTTNYLRVLTVVNVLGTKMNGGGGPMKVDITGYFDDGETVLVEPRFVSMDDNV